MTTITDRPWAAHWSLVLGFFLIALDGNIVAIANPAIQRSFTADTTAVIWVTSSYLLAYVIPLLLAGRLGDRYGQKRLYLTGLTVFVVASLLCAVAPHILFLIVARAIQGAGAAIMLPQTMAVITRIFPVHQRAAALSVWGSTAGVATLLGPIVGGLLVSTLTWHWIFLITIPLGTAGFILALRFVPTLPTHQHSFDALGVVLSAAGLLLIVIGLQEGEQFSWHWGIWATIGVGVVLLIGFVLSQRFARAEPLMPLTLFQERNFSLAGIAIAIVSFAVTGLSIPLAYYFQTVRGLSALEAALMLIPAAVGTGALPPLAGRLSNRLHPRTVTLIGMIALLMALIGYSVMLRGSVGLLWLLAPSVFAGIGNAFLWAPISNIATRRLPPADAGAGAGVFNTLRQTGAVVGSAVVATLITARTGARPATVAGLALGYADTILALALVVTVGGIVVACFAPLRYDTTAR